MGVGVGKRGDSLSRDVPPEILAQANSQGGGGGEGTPYNALYCDAPPEKAYFFQASGTERVAGISPAEVHERVWEICPLV